MSVYIKGFPLPNNCGACPLRLAWCRERIYMVTRPERCPLVPVPPHGRLRKRIVYRGEVYNALESARVNALDGILSDRYKEGFHDGLKKALEILGGLPDAKEGE